MCGIFGTFVTEKNESFEYSQVKETIEKLFKASLWRGSEAAGLAIYVDGKKNKNEHHIEICKVTNQAPNFLKSDEYTSIVNTIANTPLKAIIGHARLATNGSSKLQKNNQPVVSKNETVIGVHNGIITNFEKIHSSGDLPELDTQVVLDFIELQIIKKNQTIEQAIADLLSASEGTLNLALLFPTFEKIALVTNHGSLYVAKGTTGVYYFASESQFLKNVFNTKESRNIQDKKNKYTVTQLQLNKPYVFELDFQTKNKKLSNKSITHFTFSDDTPEPTFLNSLSKLKNHTIDTKKIAAIPRCSKCILPVTTPFISFDNKGVCNYCHEHTKINYKGLAELEKIISPYRSHKKNSLQHNPKNRKQKTSKPDCLVAFSGGRDSSYGLHLIKNELGMNPIAYTYDWGMISDLGRRNQARVLQKLGVEQIVVSADIAMKRRHIRKNIMAWMKKPHLGMVPLFMQGDKQCEFYADKIMKEYDIPLMFYCRGNELEKEEFKTGHCGVRDADPGGVIHDLAWKNKLKLLGFYGLQYAKNPAYFNESTFDTAFAYFSTYVQPHNYVYLWHYLPWNEDIIVSTLKNEYGWELSQDTPTSWRIGDGTPAFYNYIYYQVQGFTENDSLRARQVREGILSRDRALELVMAENAPQYENLKWYFDTLGLDGDTVLEVVDGMEREY